MFFFCDILSIKFDGNNDGKFYYTRNMEDNRNVRFLVQVETAFLFLGDTIPYKSFPFRLEKNLKKLHL